MCSKITPPVNQTGKKSAATQLVYIETTGNSLKISKGSTESTGGAGQLQHPSTEFQVRGTSPITKRNKSHKVLGMGARLLSDLPLIGIHHDDWLPIFSSVNPTYGGSCENGLRKNSMPNDGVVPRRSHENGTSSQSLQPYFDQLRAKLSQTIQPPPEMTRGEIFLRFIIDKHGNVQKFSLIEDGAETSSLLQQEVEKGIQEASPFPPLPASVGKETAAFTIRILFRRGSV